MRPSAFCPLKVLITASAMAFSANTISAMMVGLEDMMRHDVVSMWPLVSVTIVCSADSMSAAVVPGAKLLASTTNGPAAPLMLRPGPWGSGGVETLTCCLLLTAVASLFVFAIFAVAELGLEGGLKEEGLTFVLEFDRYRSRSIVSDVFDRRFASFFSLATSHAIIVY